MQMRLDDQRQSDNLEDKRGHRGVGGKSVGIVGLLAVLAASYFFGVEPSVILNMVAGGEQETTTNSETVPANDPKTIFVSRVLASTEDAWDVIFQEAGKTYVRPKLALYTGSLPTACGRGQAAMGPFYCPGDQKVYIDLSFYQVMKDKFGASGDFAEAYVIAHEIGHHVQYLMGISDKMEAARGRVSSSEYNALSVRMELQADCFAGVWAKRADSSKNFLEPGDIEAAVRAASAIGDDALQKQSQGHVVPDSFTHGTSAQRVRWLQRGLASGQVNDCDTFAAARL